MDINSKKVQEFAEKQRRIRIGGTVLDRRKKINDEQREAIAILREHGWGQTKIAKALMLSKSTVDYQIHPNWHIGSATAPSRKGHFPVQYERSRREYVKHLKEEGIL